MPVVDLSGRRDLLLWVGTLVAIPLLSANGRALQHWLFSTLERAVLAWGIGLALLGLVMGAVAWLTRQRQGWRLPVVVGVVLLCTLVAVVTQLHRVEEQVHFITFGLFGFLTGRVVPLPLAVMLALGVSAGDELFQAWLPDRVGDWRDVAMNAVAAGMGLVVSALGRGRPTSGW